LSSSDARLILLKGAAFANTLYDPPVLRHCHDIDLLVEGFQVSRCCQALAPVGFSVRPGPAAHALLLHTSGLPLRLHTRPFLQPLYDAPFERLFKRSEQREVAGIPIRVLCAADALVHICGHASTVPGVEALRWVGDAWLLVRKAGRLDWSDVVEQARAMNVSVPAWVRLHYLANELGSAIPSSALADLQNLASAAGLEAVRAAFQGTLLGSRKAARLAGGIAKDWRARLLLSSWSVHFRGKAIWERWAGRKPGADSGFDTL
jgi:hypothetical protein